jgi:3-dehydroquinate dehydratase type I
VIARICVSILPKNKVEALNLIKQAEEAQADLIEVRLDYFEKSIDIGDLTKSTRTPLIATNKLQSERGFFTGDDAERQHTLLNAAKNGFKYVDIDVSSPRYNETINKIKLLGVKSVASYHKFTGALNVSEMEKILDIEIASGANVCKIVTTANQIEDNLTVLNFISEAYSKAKLVCFCMGEYGKISRLLSAMFGAFFTFASLNQGSETVTGQMSVEEMRSAYELLGMKR